MHDIVDIIKNIQTLSANDSAFKILKDFERVIDELDLYVFKNWEDGELLAGPEVNRYTVTCKFLWPRDHMPDPVGGERLLDYGCKVTYARESLMVPRKVYKAGDFRPGTKKGKIDAHPVWVVTISMPKKLMQDIFQGSADNDNRKLADMMRIEQLTQVNAGSAANEALPTDPTAPVDQGAADAQAPPV